MKGDLAEHVSYIPLALKVTWGKKIKLAIILDLARNVGCSVGFISRRWNREI